MPTGGRLQICYEAIVQNHKVVDMYYSKSYLSTNIFNKLGFYEKKRF